MSLSFQPACLPMVQSGLPHDNLYYAPSQAIGLLRSTMPAIFTWPCLPKRSFCEHGHVQSITGFPGLTIDSTARRVHIDRSLSEQDLDRIGLAYLQGEATTGALATDVAATLAELLRKPEYLSGSAAVMSQLFGPISLGLQLTDERRRPLAYDPMLLESTAQFLALRVAWLVKRFTDLFDGDVIVCLDEPLLSALSSPFCPIDWNYAAELLDQVFVSIPATRGCRGIILRDFGARQRDHDPTTVWSHVLDTSVELILLDVYRYSSILLAAGEILPAFLDRPGILAWGLVPAEEQLLARETPDTLVARFEQMLSQLAALGLSHEQVLQSSFISINGSLAHLSIESVEKALRLCADISTQLRAIYGLK